MRARSSLVWVLATTITGCGAEPPESVVHLPSVSPAARMIGDSTSVHERQLTLDSLVLEIVATGLEVPWDLEVAPDGRVFFTERPGRIRIIDEWGPVPEPWASLDVFATDPTFRPETGLLGLALSPDFEESGHVYVLGVFWKSHRARSNGLPARIYRKIMGSVSPYRALRFEGRVYRLTDRNGRATEPRLVIDGLPADYYHVGGALEFGPDGMLYVTTGDARLPHVAGATGALNGAVLRYRPDGSIPADNPIKGSPVFASGLRNPQAIVWDLCGNLIAVEHGPSGFANEDGRRGNDELNIIHPGANYGWPEVTGLVPEADSEAPLIVWDPAIAPAGVARYAGEMFPEWRGDLFVAGLQRGGQLRRLAHWRQLPESDSTTIEESLLIDGELGRLRLIRMGTDGYLYLGTSNTDGRGRPREGDDRIFRVVNRRGSPIDASSSAPQDDTQQCCLATTGSPC